MNKMQKILKDNRVVLYLVVLVVLIVFSASAFYFIVDPSFLKAVLSNHAFFWWITVLTIVLSFKNEIKGFIDRLSHFKTPLFEFKAEKTSEDKEKIAEGMQKIQQIEQQNDLVEIKKEFSFEVQIRILILAKDEIGIILNVLIENSNSSVKKINRAVKKSIFDHVGYPAKFPILKKSALWIGPFYNQINKTVDDCLNLLKILEIIQDGEGNITFTEHGDKLLKYMKDNKIALKKRYSNFYHYFMEY